MDEDETDGMHETDGMNAAELSAYYDRRDIEIAAEIAARSVDILGLDKAELLVALFSGTPPLGLGFLDPRSTATLPREDAQTIIEKCPRLDYVRGRPIKVDLRKDLVDPVLYDRDAGEGAFARIVERMKGEAL